MLDTADFEWCTSPPGALAPPAGGLLGALVHLEAAGASGPPQQPGTGATGGDLLEQQEGAEGAGAPGGLSVFHEEELKCPICLDVMYKPVGEQGRDRLAVGGPRALQLSLRMGQRC
jgi:hypothetical protein